MAEEGEDTGRVGRRGSQSDGWSWQKSERTPGGLLGKRSFEEDRWTWLAAEGEVERRRPGLRLALTGTGAVLALVAAAAAVFFTLRSAGYYSSEIGDGSSPRPTALPTSETLAPTAGPATIVGFFTVSGWDRPGAEWLFDELPLERPALPQSATAVPFLLLIENAIPGQVYAAQIRYDCRAGGAEGFSFLTDYDRDAGTGPALTAPGPGRSLPDTSARIPDDASTTADDQHGSRQFALWGATFEGAPSVPTPQTPCSGQKALTVRILARAPIVHLLWSGHLQTSVPAGQISSFRMQAAIEGMQQPPTDLQVTVTG
jgi:hypothetical protein